MHRSRNAKSAVPLPGRPILQLQLRENVALRLTCDFETGVQVEHAGTGEVDVLLFGGVAADGAFELAGPVYGDDE